MIEKKTEIEIINESLDNIKDTSRKVWISEDSLIKWLKEHYNWSKENGFDEECGVWNGILLELESVKEK